MPSRDLLDIDRKSLPFSALTGVRRLDSHRRGQGSVEHARHQLYIGTEKKTSTHVLVKVTSKPGVFYQQDLSNEVASLLTINRDLPRSRYFAEVRDHGTLRDSRTYLVTSLFDELPLAMTIGPERIPERLVGQLRTTIEITHALMELHGIGVFHVDLNTMNILFRSELGRPIIRIVDFESSYEVARHGAGSFYNPPTTPRYSAPELSEQAPDARSDVFSLGAVLYTMLAGLDWTWRGDAYSSVAADSALDPPLKDILLTAVANQPARRFGSAKAMQDALGSYLERIWPGREW